jgi:hypothetical protein
LVEVRAGQITAAANGCSEMGSLPTENGKLSELLSQQQYLRGDT